MNDQPIPTPEEISAIVGVVIVRQHPGNSWESGTMNPHPRDTAAGNNPRYNVPKGMTYIVNLISARTGKEILTNREYMVGSGLAYLPNGKPAKLDTAGVVASFVRDAELGNDTFDEFCSSLGCDTDSCKALAQYLDCQSIQSALSLHLNIQERDVLNRFAQDY